MNQDEILIQNRNRVDSAMQSFLLDTRTYQPIAEAILAPLMTSLGQWTRRRFSPSCWDACLTAPARHYWRFRGSTFSWWTRSGGYGTIMRMGKETLATSTMCVMRSTRSTTSNSVCWAQVPAQARHSRLGRGLRLRALKFIGIQPCRCRQLRVLKIIRG